MNLFDQLTGKRTLMSRVDVGSQVLSAPVSPFPNTSRTVREPADEEHDELKCVRR